MKQSRRILTTVLLGLCCLALLAGGTYAAYTSHAYVKRVVSTQAVQSDLRFSSNYLAACPVSAPEYVERVISVSGDADAVFGVTVCNYPQHDLSRVNENDITYTLTVTLVNSDGTAYSGDTGGITVNSISLPTQLSGQTLPGGSATQNLYTVRIPAEKIAALSNCFLRLTAIPENAAATGGSALAGQLRVTPASAQAAGWSGRFTDDLSDPKALDAFNYELSGSAQGTVTLTWTDRVQLGLWSQQLLGASASGNSITFSVGGADQPTVYPLQFYRVGGIPEDETGADVRGYVSCSFRRSE